jgi:hypothetical protein
MTRVMLGQGMVPMLLLTVHGHICPIGGSRCRGLGVPMARRLARVLYVSLGRDESKLRGSDAFDDAMGARARRKNVTQGTHLTQDLSTRFGWDGVCHSCHKRLTCCLRFWWVDFTGPLDGALAIIQGAVFYHLFGTLVF